MIERTFPGVEVSEDDAHPRGRDGASARRAAHVHGAGRSGAASSPKLRVVDVTVSSTLFRRLDPNGLLRGESACSFLDALRTRLREPFPRSRAFLRFRPASSDPLQVLTLPPSEETEAVVRRIADRLFEQGDWIRYDAATRCASI